MRPRGPSRCSRRKSRPNAPTPWKGRPCANTARKYSPHSDSNHEPAMRAPTRNSHGFRAGRRRDRRSMRKPRAGLHALLHGLPRRPSRRSARQGPAFGAFPRPVHAHGRGAQLSAARARRVQLRAVGRAIGGSAELAGATIQFRGTQRRCADVHRRRSHGRRDMPRWYRCWRRGARWCAILRPPAPLRRPTTEKRAY